MRPFLRAEGVEGYRDGLGREIWRCIRRGGRQIGLIAEGSI
jgi:hypothetical protein